MRETRTVTFKKGVNPLQFSWANTLIDPTSVELKFLTGADKGQTVMVVRNDVYFANIETSPREHAVFADS